MKVISIKPDTAGKDIPLSQATRTIQDVPGQTFMPGMKPEPKPEQITLFDN